MKTTQSQAQHRYKSIILLAIPAILANLTLPLQGIIDAAIIGNLYPPNYLSAVGLGAQFFSVIFISFNFLQYTTTSLNAQAFGQQNTAQMRYILYRALMLSSIIALLLLLVQGLLFALAGWFFEAKADTEALMQDYIQIRIFGGFFNLANYCFIGWLSSQAENKKLLLVQLLISVLNVIFNFIFLYFFDWGVKGVAYGTVLSSGIGCIFAGYLINQRLKELGELGLFANIDWSRLIKFDELIQVMALNRDFFIRTLILTLSLAWVSRLSSQQGELVLAANVVLFNLLYLAAHGLDGVVLVTESLVGQAWGRRDIAAFRFSVKRTLVVVVIFALMLVFIYGLGSNYYIRAVIEDAEVINVAIDYRYWAVFVPLVSMLAFQLDGVFLACAAKAEIRNTVIFTACVFFPLSYFFERWYDNNGIWLSLYLFYLLRGGLLTYYFPRLTKRLL